MNSLLRSNKLKFINKFTSRYQPYTLDHATWPKPFNTLDNADPTRFDKNITDEYDLVQRNFKQGEKPPLAWKASREFPDWYRPYLLNYFGNGYIALALGFLFLLVWIQDAETKRLRGRKKLKDFRHENKRIGGYSVRNTLRKHKLTLPDPEIAYVRRYIKESGF